MTERRSQNHLTEAQERELREWAQTFASPGWNLTPGDAVKFALAYAAKADATTSAESAHAGTVPWPKVVAYAGGAASGGVASWMKVRLGNGPEETEFVRKDLAARPATSAESEVGTLQAALKRLAQGTDSACTFLGKAQVVSTNVVEDIIRALAARPVAQPDAGAMTERDHWDYSLWQQKLAKLADEYYATGPTSEARRRARANLVYHALDCATGWRARSHLAASAQATQAVEPVAQPPASERSTWWALVMGAAASIEDAARCLRDPDALRQAEGAAKHYRRAAQELGATPLSTGAPAGMRAPLEIAREATQASSAVGAERGIRDAFSRWATLEKNLNTRIRTAPFRAGEYADESCNLAWDAWQAALATTPLPSSLPAAQTAEPKAREAFEARGQHSKRLLWKRGGSVFAEDVPEGDYVDPSVQHDWLLWLEAWNTAHNIGAAPAATDGSAT